MKKCTILTLSYFFVVFVSLCLVGCTPEPFPAILPSVDLPNPEGQSKVIVDEIITVNSDELLDLPFDVNAMNMHNVRVVGWFMASGGSRNDIKVLILDDIDFINWNNLHEVEGVYKSGKLTIGKIDVPITASGKYHLIFDNRFSEFSSKNVLAKVYLFWSE